ncbi:MAG: DUF4118 domain-containing protein [Actinomycetota bacterium]|nr:DUF4118 domain-containing protein [Actinomycetota bacterium]
MDLSSRPRLERFVVLAAVVAPLAVSAALVPFRTTFPGTDGALLLVVVIVALAAYGHRLAGLLAAASAAAWFDFFLTAPYEHFTITRRADIETTCLLLVVGAAATELAVRGRRYRIRAETEAGYLAAIGVAAGPAASGERVWNAADDVAARLVELLGLRGCQFEQSSFGGLPRLEPDGRVRVGETDVDVEAYGFPGPSVELLAQSNGRTYGRFVLAPTPGTVVASDARRVASILASQVAATIAYQSAAPRPTSSGRSI